MSEKARGGLFAALGDIEDLTVLDAFSGTGALSFEAISRGADSALAIEVDRSAQDTIAKNIRELGVSKRMKVVKANSSAWSDTNQEALFNLVLCDPPYDNLQENLLEKLTLHVKPGGLFILSWPGKDVAPDFEGLERLKDQNYGDIQLVFYRRKI